MYSPEKNLPIFFFPADQTSSNTLFLCLSELEKYEKHGTKMWVVIYLPALFDIFSRRFPPFRHAPHYEFKLTLICQM